ncbi:uncharacterized protein LOC101995869 isoform X2 [Microtus ochrogaster]|uniref:Uncharacterized protein LOC101995869 isoform X2 n=2 Tax=Microtus TaxID=10053 RepID=A0ABM1UKM6_MICOH|nr:uncharacterized protein LOC101995869 isoform X2 [Microtus ochrogaster]
MTQPHCCQTALLDDSTPRSLDNRPSNALTSSDFHIINPILSRCGLWLAGGHLPQGTAGARDMSRLRRYEVALEAEEEIYWGCFYFFPWLRMWRRERRLPLTSWHPWNKTKQKQEGLPLPSSSTCCTQLYRQPLPNRLLRKILHVELQEADGDCHLQAIVLHLPRRTVCVHPQNGSLARWFERHGKSLQGTLSNLNLELQMKMYSSPQQQN